ncbi:hypothetical protein PMAYCL1PPCAC_26195, partial [Pristionchus mayeri]
FLGVTILIVQPFLFFFTSDAMKTLKQNSSSLSSPTQVMARKMLRVFLVQCLGGLICYITPLAVMLATMVVNCTLIPGWLLAIVRITFL